MEAFYSTNMRGGGKELLPVSTNTTLISDIYWGNIQQYNPKVTEHGLWVIPLEKEMLLKLTSACGPERP